ncbi:Ig-like domain-containing protein, partial [Candidatus Palauibacter sp.]|uniref:Ig-like domain-containing protein n=1 Tax=Candidatus Palauibacter sp. TaxID=3101350 RepID=UPI003B59C652
VAGRAAVTVTASDPGGLAAEQRIAVTVAKAPPPPNRNRRPAPVGRIAPRTLEAGGSETLDAAPYFGDPDDDELTYSASSSDESVATASVSGSAVTVAAVAAGRAAVTVTASDPGRPGGGAAHRGGGGEGASAPQPEPAPGARGADRAADAGGGRFGDAGRGAVLR